MYGQLGYFNLAERVLHFDIAVFSTMRTSAHFIYLLGRT
ncbi:hypothetical protein DFP75_105184 [Marinomonas alcarazii]|uniref:Uncharacterized protein n=1 Tax=Marinomonas alcarazii TaxID=491949 RepID=A0A318UXE8_9GAMM|nr:hypothetical protein DFP75_105184 [Marinomonas alcarazii]